jgi:hypothetical protein
MSEANLWHAAVCQHPQSCHSSQNTNEFQLNWKKGWEGYTACICIVRTSWAWYICVLYKFFIYYLFIWGSEISLTFLEYVNDILLITTY